MTRKLFGKKLPVAALLIVLVMALAFSACDLLTAKLEWINATYTGGDVPVGGTLDRSKVSVSAVYSNRDSREVTGWTYELDVMEAGEKTVTVTYTEGGVTVTDSFTVNVVWAEEATLLYIEAVYNGNDVALGKSLNLNDVVVTAHYTDGSSRVVEEWALSGFESNTVGEKTVTVTYRENGVVKSATFKVVVGGARLVGLNAEYVGGDVFVGDKVSKADVHVTAVFDNESQEVVQNFTLSPESFDAAGAHTVTVSYTFDDVTETAEITVNVIALVPSSLEVTADITVDYADLEIDPEAVQVTIHYTNNATAVVEDFQITDVTPLRGEKESDGYDHGTFVVTYTENGVTLSSDPITFAIRGKFVSMEVEYRGGDVYVGQTIAKSDIALIAHYDNEAYVDGDDYPNLSYTITPSSFDAAGTHTVTVECAFNVKPTLVGGGSATFELEVLPVVLESITAEYTGGNVLKDEQPDATQLVVTAYYNNGTHKQVNNFNKGILDTSAVGEKQWEISYTENQVTKTTFVTITVVEFLGPTEDDYDVNVIKDEELSIHFLMLGNKYTGDSVYIKAGDTDILIDAGSRYDSAATIANYVNQYCTDGILEYVVATHAHQDHIAGFVTSGNGGGILARYECKNIIKYALTSSTSNVRTYFENAVESEKKQGANVFTANDCINNANGAKKEFTLADGITMEILDQKYYRQKTSEENDYSVCLMIKQGENNYLFTGDLEEAGEASLVQLNPNLPQVKLWKGGHHGSYTAGSTTLLKKIQPETVCICTCMGTTEYMKGAVTNHIFPAQEFVERVSQYTDRVYCTSDGTKFASSNACIPANGNIVFACTKGQITMYFSNNNLKLKETDWFKTTSWFKNNPNIHQSWYN